MSMARYETIGFWEFQKRFSTEESCRDYLFQLRWPKGFVCPKCGGIGCYPLKGRKEYVCRQCHKQASVTAGTVMHRSHLPLVKWFWAMYLMVTDKRGVSAKQLAAELDISYHSAWYLLRRLRSAMGERDEQYLLSGIVAMDETFFGAPGKGKHGRGTGKSSVLVALSKDEQGRPQYMRFSVADVTQKSIQSFLTKCVAPGSTIQTDGLNLYRKPLAEAGYSHQVFENKEDSDALKWVHTILANAKAFIQGTYHGLGVKYLQEYLDEFTYRLNRRMHPKELFPRFVTAVASSHILGADD